MSMATESQRFGTGRPPFFLFLPGSRFAWDAEEGIPQAPARKEPPGREAPEGKIHFLFFCREAVSHGTRKRASPKPPSERSRRAGSARGQDPFSFCREAVSHGARKRASPKRPLGRSCRGGKRPRDPFPFFSAKKMRRVA